MQEGQGEAPGLQRVHGRANDVSSTLGGHSHFQHRGCKPPHASACTKAALCLKALCYPNMQHCSRIRCSGICHPPSASPRRCAANSDIAVTAPSAATMHDAADTDSETEAVQEAATVPEGAGFGAENDMPLQSDMRDTSVVSNADSGGGGLAATDDDASLVQGAAHSAFAGGGRPQQAASEVQVRVCDIRSGLWTPHKSTAVFKKCMMVWFQTAQQ